MLLLPLLLRKQQLKRRLLTRSGSACIVIVSSLTDRLNVIVWMYCICRRGDFVASSSLGEADDWKGKATAIDFVVFGQTDILQ